MNTFTFYEWWIILNNSFYVFTCPITLYIVCKSTDFSLGSGSHSLRPAPPCCPPTFNGAIMSSVNCEVRGWPQNMHLSLLSCVGWRWRQLLLCSCSVLVLIRTGAHRQAQPAPGWALHQRAGCSFGFLSSAKWWQFVVSSSLLLFYFCFIKKKEK